jgi:hypothetical protein
MPGEASASIWGRGRPFPTSTAAADGHGRRGSSIDPSWNLRPLLRGGLATEMGLRAMENGLDDPAHLLRTAHTAFVTRAADGPVATDDPPLLDDGSIDPQGLVVPADTMPGAVGEQLGCAPTGRLRHPAVDLLVRRLKPARVTPLRRTW